MGNNVTQQPGGTSGSSVRVRDGGGWAGRGSEGGKRGESNLGRRKEKIIQLKSNSHCCLVFPSYCVGSTQTNEVGKPMPISWDFFSPLTMCCHEIAYFGLYWGLNSEPHIF
jgi:hypothetical protein